MNEDFEVSTKEFFKILSKGIVDQGHRKDAARHISIKEYDLELNYDFSQKVQEMRENTKSISSDVCVVYSVWDNFEYVKYAYLSILSNYLRTDLERFDLKVILAGELSQFSRYLRPVFSSLGADVLSDSSLKFKYIIPEIYSHYDAIFNVDADAFFLGGKVDLYTKLFKRYKTIQRDGFFKTPYLVYGEDRFSDTKTRFHLPMRVTSPKKFGMDHLDKDKFVDYWVNEVDFMSLTRQDFKVNLNTGWIWNIFSLYTPKIFDTEKFRKLSKLGQDLEIWDDEFIYNLYFWDEDIPHLYLENFNDIHFVRKGLVPDGVPNDKLSIIHPTNNYNPEVKKIFSSIESDFRNL